MYVENLVLLEKLQIEREDKNIKLLDLILEIIYKTLSTHKSDKRIKSEMTSLLDYVGKCLKVSIDSTIVSVKNRPIQ